MVFQHKYDYQILPMNSINGGPVTLIYLCYVCVQSQQEEMMSIEQSYSIFPSADVKTEPPDYSEQDQPGPSSTEAAEERPSSPQQEQE